MTVRPRALALAALWTLGAAVALSVPGRFLPAVHDEWATLLHGVLFAGAGLLWALALPRWWWLAGLVLLALTLGSEAWQATVIPERGAQWTDVSADVIGLAVGLGAALLFDRRPAALRP